MTLKSMVHEVLQTQKDVLAEVRKFKLHPTEQELHPHREATSEVPVFQIVFPMQTLNELQDFDDELQNSQLYGAMVRKRRNLIFISA